MEVGGVARRGVKKTVQFRAFCGQKPSSIRAARRQKKRTAFVHISKPRLRRNRSAASARRNAHHATSLASQELHESTSAHADVSRLRPRGHTFVGVTLPPPPFVRIPQRALHVSTPSDHLVHVHVRVPEDVTDAPKLPHLRSELLAAHNLGQARMPAIQARVRDEVREGHDVDGALRDRGRDADAIEDDAFRPSRADA